MTKKLFYCALAAVIAVCMSACSSDDDNGGSTKPANLPALANADKAVQFELPTALAPTSETGIAKDEAPSLKAIEVTESSKLLLELRNPQTQDPIYVLEDVTINGNTYTARGEKVRGTVQVISNSARQTRAGESAELAIDITVTLSKTEIVTFKTDANGTIVSKTTTPISTEEAMTNLVRTWNILGTILDLKGKDSDVTVYEEFKSNANGVFDLNDVLDEILEHDVNLTEEEKKEFDRKIKNITVTSTNKFIFTYADGTEDVAEWKWTNAQKTSFSFKFKNKDMGNKFLTDDTKVEIAYNGNRCNLKLISNFKDNSNKNWDASLLLQLQAAE